jgi:uncharacterized small protein (DUF1192 family)
MNPSILARGCWAEDSSPRPESILSERPMAALDEESVFGQKRKPPTVHEIGQNIDDLSAPELAYRIDLLRAEIARLERAIEGRQATRAAADAAFKL